MGQPANSLSEREQGNPIFALAEPDFGKIEGQTRLRYEGDETCLFKVDEHGRIMLDVMVDPATGNMITREPT